MGLLSRASFARGWMPDADPVNGPVDALLRADNLVLDERGVVALRPGSAKINAVALASAAASTDIHSLYTAYLSGTRYRMLGIGNDVFVNGSSLSAALNGSGDIAFGSHLGQILFARGTSKKKYDGTTVRNWGIAQTAGAPTVAAGVQNYKVLATCNNGESPGFTCGESDAAIAQDTGQDGTANGAVTWAPEATTSRGTMTKVFAAETDCTTYTDPSGSYAAGDNDIVQFYVYLTEPAAVTSITLEIDVNGASTNPFQDDYFSYTWKTGEVDEAALTDDDFLSGDYTSEGRGRREVEWVRRRRGRVVTQIRRDKPIVNAGWNTLQIRRGQMGRVGQTSGKGWNTVKALRVTVLGTGGAGYELKFDDFRLVGGPITGLYKWKFVYVNNNSTYTALSAPSAASAEFQAKAQAVTMSVPADASRDSQVNEIWVFRMGGDLDAYYRTKVHSTPVGTGAIDISDTLSDRDALIADIRLESDNAVPPDSILDIEGPYYDRTFALTATHLYPSRRLNPDSFSAGQVVRVADASETAYWVRKALGGLYVGTSKDIYRLDGTGAELPDGTVDFTLTPLNIDHAPISEAVAQEGNVMVYLADDGWRAVSGGGSSLLTGETSLLYRGQTRHGVSAVNVTGGRFRAAIAKGRLTAITPEGASTTSSTVLYRHTFAAQRWDRHVYLPSWRCVYREPDGTLIASDTAGFVWTLDTGTQDAAVNIVGVTLWTKVDDDGKPFNRKDPWNLIARLDSGNVVASIAVHLDGSGSAATTISATQNGMGVTLSSLAALATCRQVQLRVTGPAGGFPSFKWYDFGIDYRDRPVIQVFAEPKPETPSLSRRRFGGLHVIVDTLNAAATITPVLDDVDQTPISLTTNDAVASTLTFATVVGRDLWAKIAKATGFELYQVQPLVTETLPQQFFGRVPDTNAGYAGEKVLAGLKLRVCTLGVACTFTPILDGVLSLTTFTVQTQAAEPDTYLYQFSAPQTATDIGWSVSGGNIELYDWEPLVLYQLPPRVKAWENKPLVASAVRRRFGGFTMQVDTQGAAVTVTPVLDGVDQTTLATTTSDLLGKTLTFDAIVGRDLWCRIAGSTAFVVHQVQPIVTETLPQQWKGTTPRSTFGYPGYKRLSGLQLRLCTFGAAVSVTPYLDGVAQTALSVTTGDDDPDDVTYQFATAPEAIEIALAVSGDVELYSWAPLVTAQRPLGVKAWDSGPLDLGVPDLTWIREVRLKAYIGADLTVTPYFDDVAWPSVTIASAGHVGTTTVLTVPVGRGYKGRTPRLVVTSTVEFFPYWVEVLRRATSAQTDKKPTRFTAQVGGQVSA